jgi:hypothetical protein
MAERPDGPPRPTLPPALASRVERVLFALVDIDAGEERDEFRRDWLAFVETLDELDAEDAEGRVHSFALILDGLIRSPDLLDEDAAQNSGDAPS